MAEMGHVLRQNQKHHEQWANGHSGRRAMRRWCCVMRGAGRAVCFCLSCPFPVAFLVSFFSLLLTLNRPYRPDGAGLSRTRRMCCADKALVLVAAQAVTHKVQGYQKKPQKGILPLSWHRSMEGLFLFYARPRKEPHSLGPFLTCHIFVIAKVSGLSGIGRGAIQWSAAVNPVACRRLVTVHSAFSTPMAGTSSPSFAFNGCRGKCDLGVEANEGRCVTTHTHTARTKRHAARLRQLTA